MDNIFTLQSQISTLQNKDPELSLRVLFCNQYFPMLRMHSWQMFLPR